MVQEIDAYWLQRRISQTLDGLDAAAAQRLAQEVLEALQVSVFWQWCIWVQSHQCAGGWHPTDAAAGQVMPLAGASCVGAA